MKSSREIPMKQWRLEMAVTLGLSEAAVIGRLYRTKAVTLRIPYPPVRRVNKRVVFVKIGGGNS